MNKSPKKDRKHRILHIIGSLDIGGTEAMLLRTLPRLPEFSHTVCSLTTKGEIGAQLEENGISVITLEQNKVASWQTFSLLVSLIRRERPDIVQTYLLHADLMGRFAARIAKVPRIITSIRSKLLLRYLPIILFDAMTSPLVTDYLSNSRVSANWYIKHGIPRRKMSVIHNGIELDLYRRPIDREKVRMKLGIPLKAPLLGCVAKLRPHKGHDVLLEATRSLVPRFPDVKLILIGDGPLRSMLEERVRQLNIVSAVTFLGNRSDVIEILSTLDIFVLPTLYEGMSNAIMEAMASGCSIVTTDIAENRELIENNVHGLLIKSQSVTAIEEAVQKLLTDRSKARLLGAHARERIEREFSIERTVAELRKFYQK